MPVKQAGHPLSKCYIDINALLCRMTAGGRETERQEKSMRRALVGCPSAKLMRHPFTGPAWLARQGSRIHIDLAGGIVRVSRNLNTDGAGHRTRPARPKPLKAVLPLSLAGFNTVVLLKGRCGFRTENNKKLKFISKTNLVLDIGQLLENALNRVEVFAGFQYWHNKFGGDPRKTLNTEEKALIAGVAYHIK